MIKATDVTSPAFENNDRKSSSVVVNGRFPTNNFDSISFSP
jgi:hypothetical protein